MRAVTPLLLLALLLLPLAGCLRKADEPAAAPLAGTQAGGALARAQGAANATALAPAWSVGQSWTHKWTLVGGGDGGRDLTFLIRTVVAEQAGDGWTLATDNQTMAAFHGAFVIPTLGHFSRGLVQSVGETRFPWYHFPLAANATWSDSVVTWDGAKSESVAVQGRVASVTHSPDGAGIYHVEMSADGRLLAAYDYDTATQWFDEARFFDGEGKVAFRSEMQETHRGFTGRLYDDIGSLLVEQLDVVSAPGAVVQPDPQREFTMDAGQNRLLLFLISFAGGGAHDSEVVAPDGTRYTAPAADAVVAPVMDESRILLVPGQAGTWRTASVGAGLFVSGGFIQAYGLRERVIDL